VHDVAPRGTFRTPSVVVALASDAAGRLPFPDLEPEPAWLATIA
jgi:hypothetical protein